ncbi:MAG: TVP38/TMEM64 family protein [Desulfonatronovibrionaceae bacterium]
MKKIIETFLAVARITGRHAGILIYVLFVAALITAALFWKFSPLADRLDVSGIMAWARDINTLPLLIMASFGAFVLAGLTMFPISILNTVLALLLGPWKGFALAYFCNISSAIVCFVLIRYLGRRFLHIAAGQKIENLSRKMGKRGFLSMLIMRNSPMAFGMVNMAAALTHINFRDYFWGSVVGMLPGTLAVCLLAGEIKNMVIEPSIASFAVIGLALGILLVLHKKINN